MLKSLDRALGDILSLIPDPLTKIPYKRAVNKTVPAGETFEACAEISNKEHMPPSKEGTPIVAEKSPFRRYSTNKGRNPRIAKRNLFEGRCEELQRNVDRTLKILEALCRKQ